MNKAAQSVVTYLPICLWCSLTIMTQYTCCCHSARYECTSMHEGESMNVRSDSMRQGIFIKGGCSWHSSLISSSPNCCMPAISHSDATQWYQAPSAIILACNTAAWLLAHFMSTQSPVHPSVTFAHLEDPILWKCLLPFLALKCLSYEQSKPNESSHVRGQKTFSKTFTNE